MHTSKKPCALRVLLICCTKEIEELLTAGKKLKLIAVVKQLQENEITIKCLFPSL